MALPALLGFLSLSTRLDLTTAGTALAIALLGSKRLDLVINGLTGSGATLAIDGSRDGGATWVSTGLQVTDYDLGTSLTALVDDGDYRLVTRGYTHVQVRVGTAGSGAASVTPMPVSRAQEVLQLGGGSSGGPASSVTVSGMLPAGTNFLGYFGLNSAFTFTTAYAAALPAASAWQKVATTTATTKLLRMDYPAATTTYDAEWTWVTAGGTAPSGGLGTAILAGEDFNRGFPIGDIYMRSATAQTVIVQTGA